MADAIKHRKEHVEAFVEFDAALPQEETSKWTKMCQEWECNRSKENPFLNKRIGRPYLSFYFEHVTSSFNHLIAMSDAEVRLRLAEDDQRELQSGEQQKLHDNVSASMLVYQGLEIESIQ